MKNSVQVKRLLQEHTATRIRSWCTESLQIETRDGAWGGVSVETAVGTDEGELHILE
jgi:hypothetical protein